MSTTVNTESDLTWSDLGGSTWPGSYNGSEGDPAGCFDFLIPVPVTGDYSAAYGYGASGGYTWEDMGVPSGATVSACQITAKKHASYYAGGSASAHAMSYDIAAYPSYDPVAALGDDSIDLNSTNGWASAGSETSSSVASSYSYSTQQIIVWGLCTATMTDWYGSYYIDEIQYTITYSGGASGPSGVTSFIGVAKASISTANAVALASITSINGVT